MKRSLHNFLMGLGSAFIAGGFGVFLWGAFVCWILRDGLGPDSVTSEGWEAFARFAQDFWQYLLIAVTLSGAGAYLVRRSSDA